LNSVPENGFTQPLPHGIFFAKESNYVKRWYFLYHAACCQFINFMR